MKLNWKLLKTFETENLRHQNGDLGWKISNRKIFKNENDTCLTGCPGSYLLESINLFASATSINLKTTYNFLNFKDFLLMISI